MDLSLIVNPLVSVGTESVHMSEAIRGTAIGEKDGDLMECFGRHGPEVPCCVGIFQVGLGVSLLTVDEVRELNWVLNEENWSVVTNHIVVALFGVELDGETSGISISIS